MKSGSNGIHMNVYTHTHHKSSMNQSYMSVILLILKKKLETLKFIFKKLWSNSYLSLLVYQDEWFPNVFYPHSHPTHLSVTSLKIQSPGRKRLIDLFWVNCQSLAGEGKGFWFTVPPRLITMVRWYWNRTSEVIRKGNKC